MLRSFIDLVEHHNKLFFLKIYFAPLVLVEITLTPTQTASDIVAPNPSP